MNSKDNTEVIDIEAEQEKKEHERHKAYEEQKDARWEEFIDDMLINDLKCTAAEANEFLYYQNNNYNHNCQDQKDAKATKHHSEEVNSDNDVDDEDEKPECDFREKGGAMMRNKIKDDLAKSRKRKIIDDVVAQHTAEIVEGVLQGDSHDKRMRMSKEKEKTSCLARENPTSANEIREN